MTNQQNVNWISVLSFLQKQQMQSTIKQKQWNLQRHQLVQKINRLQSQLDANRIIITDLLNRIKLLQIALFQSKSNPGKNNHHINNGANINKQKELQIQNLLEKFKLQVKVKEDNHQQFLTQILSQIGIDSRQILPNLHNVQNQANNLFKKQDNHIFKQTGSICAHLDGVRKIFINQGKDFVVSVSEDCLVKVWSYSSVVKNKSQYLQPSKALRQHSGPLFALTGGSSPFHPQQSIFFTGGSDGLIKYWKINNNNFSQTATPITAWSCSKQNDKDSIIWDLSLQNNKLLSSASDGFVNLYQISENQGNKLKYQFKEKQFNPTCIKWISQQTFIQGCSNAPRAHIWDISGKLRQKYLYQIPKGSSAEQYQINQICFNKKLKITSFACEDGAIRLFTLNFNRMIRKIPINSSATCIKQIKDWQIMCGTHSGKIGVWDLRNYQKIQEFEKCHTPKYDEGVLCLWGQQDKIFSGGADGIIKVFS